MRHWVRVGFVVSLLVACGGETRSDTSASSGQNGGTTGGAVGEGGTGAGPAPARGGTSAESGGTGGFGGSCPANRVSCGPSCVDLQSDFANCGACGRQCCAGSTCSNGQCVVSCGNMTVCGAGSVEPECTAVCVDLTTDPSHCGQCDQACLPAGVCVGGQCHGGISEADLAVCHYTSECIVVPYSHCCGATKRAINMAYRSAYESRPDWQVFDDPGICAVIGVCPDDRAVTHATCVDGQCALVYP